ncbi:site-specific integrase [Micromonospora yasonensis]|uniref:site-specific integrase n=1 Tax=Micromonospora yasonensis TaxID=1128667 RepID=UPI00222FBE27|nr:site-specific integrase [Micromonospora yasonensis]MCW3841770.1 site-specific integrase [Micromonospora yasonensis]
MAGAEKMISADLAPIDRGPINGAVHAAAFAALLERYGVLHAIAAEYVSHLADVGKAPSTIDRALAALAVAHRSAGAGRLATDRPGPYCAPTCGTVPTWAGGCAKAKPLLVTNLRAVVATLDTDRLAGVRDRAVLVLGFALGARRSEIAALDIEDLDFNDNGVEVLIRRSKTDKDAAGRKVHLPDGTNLDTCPVRTVRAWLAAIEEHGVTSGALFRRIDKDGQMGRAPHGRGSAGGRITGQPGAIIVRRIALTAGLDAASAFSGHSLRRGFATEARREKACGRGCAWVGPVLPPACRDHMTDEEIARAIQDGLFQLDDL